MSHLLLLLLLLLVVCSSQASHFYGTVMTYYPKNTNADGSVKVVLHYKLNFHACTSSMWQCLSGNCGSVSLAQNSKVDEESGIWCQTEGISTRLIPSNSPFQLVFAGGNWINNIQNNIVDWRAVTLVELRNRSDTGQANTSPQTTILPVVRVPSNCQRDFNLLAFDPDGDKVKCRYGNTSADECNPCTPPSVLSLSSSCTLSFSPTNSSNEGPYAVQLVMEDFPRQTINLTQTNGLREVKTINDAISKIPVQFVLRVDPVVPSCTEGLYLPKFLPPTPANRAQLYTPVNQTLEISINAEANNSTVSELLFSGPYNINENTSVAGQFILRWTPSESQNGESHPICFVIQAELNSVKYHSELRCVIVTVGNEPATTTLMATTIPSTTTPQTTTPFSWTTTPQTTTPNDTSTTQSSTNVPPTSTTTFSSTTTPQATTPNDTSTTQSSTNVPSTATSTTTFSSTTTPQTTTPNDTSTTQSSTNVPSTATSTTTFSSTTTPQTTTPNDTSTTQSSTNVPSTATSTTTFSSTTTPQTTTPNDTSTTQSSANIPSTATSTTTFSSTTTPQTTTPIDTSTTQSSTSPHSVTTPKDTTTSPAALVSKNIVVVLRMRISSSSPLSEDDIRNNVMLQVKNELVRQGLPSDISVHLVSSVNL